MNKLIGELAKTLNIVLTFLLTRPEAAMAIFFALLAYSQYDQKIYLRGEIERLKNIKPDTVKSVRVDTVNRITTQVRWIVRPETVYVEKDLLQKNLFNWTTKFQDTLLTASIHGQAKILEDSAGVDIANVKLQYNFIKPIYTTRETNTITITKRDSVVIQKEIPRLHIGGFIGLNNSYGPEVTWFSKQAYSYSYGYDFGTGTHRFTARIPIRFRS